MEPKVNIRPLERLPGLWMHRIRKLVLQPEWISLGLTCYYFSTAHVRRRSRFTSWTMFNSKDSVGVER